MLKRDNQQLGIPQSEVDYMKPGEKARLSTPADQRRRQRKNILVFSLFLTAVLIGLAATVLFVNGGRNYKRLVRQYGLELYLLPAPPPPRLRVERQRQVPLPSVYPSRLLTHELDRAASFQRQMAASASDSCDNLNETGGGEANFSIAGGDWECLFLEEFGSAEERASLFVQARGAVPDSLRTFRIKLSLTDRAQDAAIFKAAVTATDLFGLALTPESRSYLSERLAGRREFTSILENYRMTFSREMTDERRFNLLILPRPQTISCEGSSSVMSDNIYPRTYILPVGCLALRRARP